MGALVNDPANQRAFGMAPRQSRLRAAIGIPTDGLLAGATLKGLVEADFAGDATTADAVIPRMRHYYVAATWKNMSNLTFTVGQTWGLAGANYFSESLAHFAMPRFGGSGILFRRSPQMRVSGDAFVSGPLSVSVAAAVFQPGDTGAAAVRVSGSPGNTSAFPNLEARVTTVYKQNSKPMAEVGVWGHYGRERYEIPPPLARCSRAGPRAEEQGSRRGRARDAAVRHVRRPGVHGREPRRARLALPASRHAAGSTPARPRTASASTDSDPAHPRYIPLKTKGGYLQANVTVVKGLQVLAGVGMENPDDNDPLDPRTDRRVTRRNLITKNTQYSAGTIATPLEQVEDVLRGDPLPHHDSNTDAKSQNRDVLPATQFEVGTLVTF